MKAELVYNWIKDTDFQAANPLQCEVVGLVLGGKNNAEKILQFKIDQGLRQISIYGENWNVCVCKLGDETDNWVGKKFRLSQFNVEGSDKKMKRIEA